MKRNVEQNKVHDEQIIVMSRKVYAIRIQVPL